jgi:hypothetical protein
MKRNLVIIFCLCFSVAIFMTVDLSNQAVYSNAAYALDAQTGYQPGPGQPISVPEPSTLLLIGIGAAGVGAYSLAKRRNRNKKN